MFKRFKLSLQKIQMYPFYTRKYTYIYFLKALSYQHTFSTISVILAYRILQHNLNKNERNTSTLSSGRCTKKWALLSKGSKPGSTNPSCVQAWRLQCRRRTVAGSTAPSCSASLRQQQLSGMCTPVPSAFLTAHTRIFPFLVLDKKYFFKPVKKETAVLDLI